MCFKGGDNADEALVSSSDWTFQYDLSECWEPTSSGGGGGCTLYFYNEIGDEGWFTWNEAYDVDWALITMELVTEDECRSTTTTRDIVDCSEVEITGVTFWYNSNRSPGSFPIFQNYDEAKYMAGLGWDVFAVLLILPGIFCGLMFLSIACRCVNSIF